MVAVVMFYSLVKSGTWCWEFDTEEIQQSKSWCCFNSDNPFCAITLPKVTNYSMNSGAIGKQQVVLQWQCDIWFLHLSLVPCKRIAVSIEKLYCFWMILWFVWLQHRLEKNSIEKLCRFYLWMILWWCQQIQYRIEKYSIENYTVFTFEWFFGFLVDFEMRLLLFYSSDVAVKKF